MLKDIEKKNLAKKIKGVKSTTEKIKILLKEKLNSDYKNREKIKEEIKQKIKDLGIQTDLTEHKGLTPGMLLTLGEQKILSLNDFADLASDELIGGFDIIKGERIRIKGYLEDFALSRKEADDLIMSAREIAYKD